MIWHGGREMLPPFSFAIVESIDAEFLSRTVGDGHGYLFSYQLQPEQFRGEDLGDELGPYKRMFQPQTLP
jgi:hypothetical protein